MQRQTRVPPIVYLLADHLDAVLAVFEDLLVLKREQELSLLRASIRRLDLQAMMHLLQARQPAKELSRSDRRISSEAALFLEATASLPEAAKEIANDSTGRVNLAELAVSNQFRIGRRVPIDTASAVAAALLDALERYYVLYEDAEKPDGILNYTPSLSDAFDPFATAHKLETTSMYHVKLHSRVADHEEKVFWEARA